MEAHRRSGYAALVLVVGGLGVMPAAHAEPGQWGEPTQLSPTGVMAHAATAGDAAVVAWTDNGSVFAGVRFADGEWVTQELGQGSRPRVAVNADGAAVAAWQQVLGDGSAVQVATRPPSGPWAEPTTASLAGRFPAPAIDESGVVRVLALRWDSPAPERTDVQLYTFQDGWNSGRVLNRRRLETSAALRRSLTLTTNASNQPVAGWLCPFDDLPPGHPAVAEWVCLRLPGSGVENTVRARAGRYAVSVPANLPVFLATPFAISEVEPGSLYTEEWGSGRRRAPAGSLDVSPRRGGGSRPGAGPDGQLWIATRRSSNWGNAALVARHTHGLSGATLSEPDTALAFWRTAAGKLRTASRVGRSSWQRDPTRFGLGVDRAHLVSTRGGDAVLAWSSASPGSAGVYVVDRPMSGTR